MSDPFIGEIRIFPITFIPDGWLLCDGSLLLVQQYQPLAALLGSTYGGDGRTNFGLPNLLSRGPLCFSPGQGVALGSSGGAAQVTLTSSQSSHTHAANAYNALGNNTSPVGAALATEKKPKGGAIDIYYTPAAAGTPVTMNQAALAPACGDATKSGAADPHDNMAPYLVMGFGIATTGIWPEKP